MEKYLSNFMNNKYPQMKDPYMQMRVNDLMNII